MFIHSKVEHEFVGSPAPTVCYMICSVPRCGSSLLGEALTNSGLAGVPTEYFDEQLRKRFSNQWKIDGDEAYLRSLKQKKTGPNGVLGMKVHVNQLERSLGLNSVPDSLPNLKFIQVRRRDLFAQSVSYARAIQTERWSSEQSGLDVQPSYDFDQLSKLKVRLEREYGKWASFFDRHAITPLEMIYEDFSFDDESIASAVTTCLNYLGVAFDRDFVIKPLTLKRQSDERSVEWITRFRRDWEEAKGQPGSSQL
jgi:LPS sulfotransferase NodH